jgi:antitoxin CptB
MTGSTRSSDGLDLCRRKLLFRSWHRGMREMDLIMGRFADAWIERLNEAELGEYERLIEVPDGVLLAWISGEGEIPAEHDGAVLRRLRAFHQKSGAER